MFPDYSWVTQGEIEIRCQLKEAVDEKIQLFFSVRDTGLGLAISKRLTELMGGQITLQSELDQRPAMAKVPKVLSTISVNLCALMNCAILCLQSKIPVVAMTANAMKGDEEKCLAAGMDAYISKPIRKEQIFQTLAQFLGV